MSEYDSLNHTKWDCKYHIVWITKYRYPILSGDVGNRCRELLREIAQSQEMTIHAGAINRDHVHMLLSIPPNLSVSKAVQFLKGKSSHKLLSEFATIRVRLRRLIKPSEHKADGGETQESQGVAGEVFPVFGQSAAAI